jgi:hypothetical protein
MGGRNVRIFGLTRAELQIDTKLAVYKLKRWVRVRKGPVSVFCRFCGMGRKKSVE